MGKILQSSFLEEVNNDPYNSNKDAVFFDTPFSELEILQLQQIFLTYGISTIKTKNVARGRLIIATILNSLKYYHHIGCITKESNLDEKFYNVYQAIQKHQNKNCSISLSCALEDFFTVNPYFDFIWIELTNELKNTSLCTNVKKIFDMYYVQQRMPVILMTYEEN